MAVEASYMNLMPSSQLLTNREIIKPNNQQQQLINYGMYNPQMDSAMPLPATTMPESIPFYQPTVCDPNKADSGLTYHLPLQRKRSRDFTTEFTSLPPHQKNKLSSQSPFMDQEFLYQFQNQQSEIDRILAQHTEKVIMELDEQRTRQTKSVVNMVFGVMSRRVMEKDEEIQRMEKLNLMLQEKVQKLCAENQVWREMAQTNETTANYLRSNLEQVLANVGEERHGVAAADDAQSSCGSNGAAEDGEDTAATPVVGGGVRMCKNCGVRESMVLLLPCRHLCLCKMCGSTVRKCPVCDSGMDASVHVNLS